MFSFVIKYLGFLKHVPLLPHVFDAWLKIVSVFTNKDLLNYMDDIESEVLAWNGTSIHVHRFGGIQFNANNKELGHIHGNGLLDILFSKKIKTKLITEGKVSDHHTFPNSGWITFKINCEQDKHFAIELLRHAHSLSAP